MTGIPFLHMIYISYLFGPTCVSSIAGRPVSWTCIILLIYDLMNVPVMSHAETSLLSLGFMITDRN